MLGDEVVPRQDRLVLGRILGCVARRNALHQMVMVDVVEERDGLSSWGLDLDAMHGRHPAIIGPHCHLSEGHKKKKNKKRPKTER